MSSDLKWGHDNEEMTKSPDKMKANIPLYLLKLPTSIYYAANSA